MSSGTNKQKPKIPPKPPDILTKNRNDQSTSSSRTFPSRNNGKTRPVIPPKPSHLIEGIKKNINHDASEEREKVNWASQNPPSEDTHFKNKDEVSIKLDLAEGQTDVSKNHRPTIHSESQEVCSKEESKCAFMKTSDLITCKTVSLEEQENDDISALNVSRTDTYEQTDNAKTQNKTKAQNENDGNARRNEEKNVLVKQSRTSDETSNITETHSDAREFNAPPATIIKILDHKPDLNILNHDTTNYAHHQNYQSSVRPNTPSTDESIDASKIKQTDWIEKDNGDAIDKIGSTSSSFESLLQNESRNKNDNTEYSISEFKYKERGDDKEYFIPLNLRKEKTVKIYDTKTPSSEVVYKRMKTPPPAIPPRRPTRPPLTKLFYISTFDFGPQQHIYLKASKGELFEILNDDNKDNWMARNKEGKEGLLPSKFVSDCPELDMYSWFYKDLLRSKCEYILHEVGTDGCFIVRQNDESMYSLSVFTDDPSGGRINHYRLYHKGKYFYLRINTMFVTLPDLLEYHSRRSGGLHTLLKSSPPLKYKETLEANELEYSHTHKLEIERTDLELIKKIGTGSFGEVHRGKLGGSDIAAETMKDVNCAEDVLLMEARILSQLSHPNIIQLYGIVTKSLPVIKVTELMQNGNLLNHLRQNKFSLINDIDTMTNMCRQVCSGLEYIHNRGYLHRNIAARSCLVGINGAVKIADFSQAKFVRNEETITYRTCKFKWTPPEILYTQAGSSKSDVWSYGVLMWEIFTCGQEPYSNVDDELYKQNIRSKKYRLLKPAACTNTIYSIMEICWAQDPSLRPTFRDLLSHLDESNLKLTDEMDNSELQPPVDLGFNQRDRELFMLALNEGKESVNFIRVMVVGNFNQGKTSLTRRLLGLPLEGIVSTDGIEIHKANCNNADFIWTKSEVNSDETDGANRLVKIVKQSKDSKSESDLLMYNADEKETDFVSSVESENSAADRDEIQLKDINDNVNDVEDPNGQSRYFKPDLASSLDTSSSSGSSESEESDESTDSMPDSKTTEILPSNKDSHPLIKGINLLSGFSQKLINETNPNEMSNAKDTHLNIWDFGGQFIYYATHQIFHSNEAIYLLVFDLTKDLDSKVEDDDFPNRKTDMRTSMKFWVESVHAFVGTEDGHEPKIILVGTHKANCTSKSDIEQKFDEVLDLFRRTKARNHIYERPFAIEITDPKDPSIDEIRRTIVHIGLEKAMSIEVPAKWIQLEVALNKLKIESKIVKFAEVVNLNASTDSPIQDAEHIKLFLKYHHAKGMLVYFDESRLEEFVVIDPQFLVDAFKCIITSKRFCTWRSKLDDMWEKLIESAVLEKYLLNSVWENDKENPFMEHRDILLAFLQRHRILAEILTFDDVSCDERGTGQYIVPSLLKSECTQSTVQRVMLGKKCTIVILGLQLKESSIIKTIFERVIAAALGRWPPLKIDETKLVFQSTAFFRLDLQHAGKISNPSENGIELSVIAQCPPDGVEPGVCGYFRRFVEAVISNEFQRLNSERQDKAYSYYIKCNHDVHNYKGSTHAHHDLDNIKKKYRVCCPDNESHAIITKQALGEWFPEQKVNKDEKARNTKITEKDLAKIAQAIGKNWELLGPFLGLHDVDVQRIKQDHPCRSETAIHHMLNTWRKQNPKLDTLFDLLKVLKECEKVSVNWDKIYKILD